MADRLNSVYETTRPVARQPFDVDQITGVLMTSPLGIDNACISHTPNSVVVEKDKDEYLTGRMMTVIKTKFKVDVVCKPKQLIFLQAKD